MILSFKPPFVPKIIAGTKIHSIREDSTRRWKAGMKIHMATGVRTKQYNCFLEEWCRIVQKIEIIYTTSSSNTPLIYIGCDNRCLDTYNPESKLSSFGIIEKLAINDGFSSVEEFLDWFDKDSEGVLIHWTDFKY